MKIIFVLVVFILSVNYTYAANIPRIYALHINGINTTQIEARTNMLALQNLTKVDSNIISFDLIWNPTGEDAGKNGLHNILEVLEQKLNEANANMSFDDFTTYYLSQYSSEYPADEYDFGSAKYKSFQDKMLNDYSDFIKSNAGENFGTILDQFQQKVPAAFVSAMRLLHGNNTSNEIDYSQSPNYVLLLPHSQGNLYANALYTYLTNVEHMNQYHIQIFGIATPATELQGNQIIDEVNKSCTERSFITCPVLSYVTSSRDMVINSLRFLSDALTARGGQNYTVLPSNLDIDFSSVDSTGHNLINTYLQDVKSSTEIKSSVTDILDYFAAGFIMPNPAKDKLATATMQVEMQGPNRHVLKSSSGIVCSNGTCPGSDGYYTFISHGEKISEYYFASQDGYETDFDLTEEKNLMHISCQDKITECKLWGDTSCDHQLNKALLSYNN